MKLNVIRVVSMCLMIITVLVPGRDSKARGEEQYELDEITVTATGIETELENAPAVVDIVDQEDIKTLPHQDAAGLIENEAGITPEQPQGMGTVTPQGTVFRGIYSLEQTLFLVDGQPWNSGFTDYFYYSYIPAEAIQRIEVVRGPFSSLYGSNAMAGVVHVITRDGMNEPAHLGAFYNFGDYGRQEIGVTLSGRFEDKASIFASYSAYSTDNYYLHDELEDEIDNTTEDEWDNRDYEHDRYHVHARLNPTDDVEVHLSGGGYRNRTGFGTGDIGAGEFDNYKDVNRYYINFRTNMWISEGAEVFVAYDYVFDESDYIGATLIEKQLVPFPPPGFRIPVFDVRRNYSGFDRHRAVAGSNLYLGNNNVLTVGGEYQWNHGFQRLEDKDTGKLLPVIYRPGEELDEHEENKSFYVQDIATYGDVILIAGVRYDDFEGFGEHWSPKGAVVWNYADTGRIKFSAGGAFRSPSFSQRASTPWTLSPNPQATLIWIGNPDLDPEVSTSYELSFENEWLGGSLSTRVSPYYTLTKDFINTAPAADPLDPDLPPTTFLLVSENIDEAEIMGVETQLEYRPTDATRIFVNYTYNESRDKDTDDILTNRPINTARAGAVYYNPSLTEFMGLSTSIVGRYVDKQYYIPLGGTADDRDRIDAYTTADARVAFLFLAESVMVHVNGFNIFNEQTNRTDDQDYLPKANYTAGVQVKYDLE